jgi:hypothetical protein
MEYMYCVVCGLNIPMGAYAAHVRDHARPAVVVSLPLAHLLTADAAAAAAAHHHHQHHLPDHLPQQPPPDHYQDHHRPADAVEDVDMYSILMHMALVQPERVIDGVGMGVAIADVGLGGGGGGGVASTYDIADGLGGGVASTYAIADGMGGGVASTYAIADGLGGGVASTYEDMHRRLQWEQTMQWQWELELQTHDDEDDEDEEYDDSIVNEIEYHVRFGWPVFADEPQGPPPMTAAEVERAVGELDEAQARAMPLDDMCPICLESMCELRNGALGRMRECGHTFCKSCITKWLTHERSLRRCPVCKGHTRPTGESAEPAGERGEDT